MSLKNIYTRSSSRNRKGNRRFLVILIVILILIGLPLFFTFKVSQELSGHSRALASAYGSQNFGQMQVQISGIRGSLQKMDLSLNFLLWLKVIPIVGGYYGDVKALVSGGVEDTIAMEKLFQELKPKEKELGFIGTPIAGQDRISQAIKILNASIPVLPKLTDNFKKGHDAVSGIDVNKYPTDFRGINLRQIISTARGFMVGAYVVTSKYPDVLKVAPGALGDPPKTYFLLFQNDKEIRATGGFMTAYAFLTMDHGQIKSSTSDDIYRLDEKLLNTCLNVICPLTPPPAITKYLPEADGKTRTAWSMRDSNFSPDVPTSAKAFEKMYSFIKGENFDGIIFIDTQVVEELIVLTGPVEVYGTKYSAEMDKRCNCPNVIYELESYAEIAAKGEKDRKAVLGVLMQQVLAKALGAKTEKLPELVALVAKLANEKHIIFYMHDSVTQSALSQLNWTGQIQNFDGDYLHINDSNFAGGKTNLYVDQTVTQEIKTSGNRTTKKIIIEYKNPQPFGIWLNGINRDYVRFYVPKGSKLISSKGSDDPVNTIEDLDKTVFDAFVTVRPQNTRKLEIEYEVAYSSNGPYKLMVQKQPGARDFHYIIKLNGANKADFYLHEDKEFTF